MKYPRARDLVENVMRARGINPDEEGAVAELARQTRFDARSLYRWWSGEFRPNSDSTIELLERAGVLRWDLAGEGPEEAGGDELLLLRRIEQRLAGIEKQLEPRKIRGVAKRNDGAKS